jgi:hypothetical protein
MYFKAFPILFATLIRNERHLVNYVSRCVTHYQKEYPDMRQDIWSHYGEIQDSINFPIQSYDEPVLKLLRTVSSRAQKQYRRRHKGMWGEPEDFGFREHEPELVMKSTMPLDLRRLNTLEKSVLNDIGLGYSLVSIMDRNKITFRKYGSIKKLLSQKLVIPNTAEVNDLNFD